MSEQKQFEATMRHLHKARNKGRVLRSPLLTRSASLVAVFISFNMLITFSWVAPELLLKCYLADNLADIQDYLYQTSWVCLLVILASLGITGLVSIAIDLFQVGFLFQPSLVAIDLERLNPIAGFKRLLKGWQDILLRLLLLAALLVCYLSFLDGFYRFTFADLSGGRIVGNSLSSLKLFSISALGCLLAFGLSDYCIQRQRYFRELRMTLKEVRDEQRETEGDPYLKVLRRNLHEQLLLQELVQRVKRAKVVVVARN